MRGTLKIEIIRCSPLEETRRELPKTPDLLRKRRLEVQKEIARARLQLTELKALLVKADEVLGMRRGVVAPRRSVAPWTHSQKLNQTTAQNPACARNAGLS